MRKKKLQEKKRIKERLHCEFIRINPARENYIKFFIDIGKIHNYIIRSTKNITEKLTKKSLTGKISNRLLEIEFEKYNSIKSKCLKYIVKKYFPHYKTCKFIV